MNEQTAAPAPAPGTRSGTRRFLIGFSAVALFLAGVVSLFASGHPDGLEYVAASTGFLDTAQKSFVAGSPLADYTVSGFEDFRLSGGLAGVIGVLVTLLLAGGLARVVRRPRGEHDPEADPEA